MKQIYFLTIIICLFSATNVIAGTYKNISTEKKSYTNTSGLRTCCDVNATCESYELLDVKDSSSWSKTSDLPLVPVEYDRLITSSSDSTETVVIEPSWSRVRLTNLSPGRVVVWVNSTANSYSPTLEVANSDNERDTITLTNNYQISTIYLQFLSTSGGTVKVEEIP